MGVNKMLKMNVFLIIAIAAVSSHAESNGDMTKLSSFILDLRTQVKHLVSKVDGINSRVGGIESKVDGINSKLQPLEQKIEEVNGQLGRLHTLETKVDGISGMLQGVSVDVESVKKGYTGNPFSSCTGQVMTVTGTTIKYPLTGNYGTNLNCKWIVKAGNNVKVSFTKFDLESGNCAGHPSGPCDYVEVLQGGQRKAKWSGHSLPSDELVLTGDFTVHFNSDRSNQFKGFQLEIEKNE